MTTEQAEETEREAAPPDPLVDDNATQPLAPTAAVGASGTPEGTEVGNDGPFPSRDHSDAPPDTPSSDTSSLDTSSSDTLPETSSLDAPRDNPSEPDSRDDAAADDDAVSSTVELPFTAKDANRPRHRAPTIGRVWGPRLAWAVLGTLVGLAIAKNVSEINQAPPETQMIAPLPEPEPVPTSPDAGPDMTDGGDTDPADTSAGTSAGTAPARATDFLWADGSVDPDDNPYWSQSTLTVKTTTPLTELKVVMRVAQTGGVASTGTWSALGDKVHVVTAADSDQLSYVVTLKPGVTVEPGTYVFQFQYNHDAGGRDATRDRYDVTATSDSSTTETWSGDFF